MSHEQSIWLTGYASSVRAQPTHLLKERLAETTRGLRDKEFLVSLLPLPMSEPMFIDADMKTPLWRGEFVAMFEGDEWKPMSADDFIEQFGRDYFKTLRRLELR